MTHYFELRPLRHESAAAMAADLTRHMEVRQYLGSSVVVCDTPVTLLSVVRKHWMQLARLVQKHRASTLNAEEILRLTHAIMHMQQMQFVAKPPYEHSEAQVFFISPEQLATLPPSCYTLYLLAPVAKKNLLRALESLSDAGLVVNYDVGLSLTKFGLLPKSGLETRVLREWQAVESLLKRHNIQVDNLLPTNPNNLAANDEALDTMLSASQEFLRTATMFQHAIHLAQPFKNISAHQQKLFIAVARLAHRVQSLSPSTFSSYLIKNFGAKDDHDIFFLHDYNFEELTPSQPTALLNYD